MDPEEGQGWSREYVERMAIAYKRFLTLLVTHPETTVAPSKDIDKFWHGHILDTMKYAEDCEQVFGYFLHHFPYFGMRGQDDAAQLAQAGEEMHRLYQQEFGEPMPQSAAAYCGAATKAAAYCGAAAPAYCGTAVEAAYCGATTAAKAAYCGASKPAYCGAATKAAYCGAAKPKNDAAYCGAVATAAYCGAAKPAYCGASTKAAYCGAAKRKKDAAYCGAVATTAYCGAAKPAYCGASTKAAYCGAAKPKAAYCGASKQAGNAAYCGAGVRASSKQPDFQTRPALELA
jgi:hypothetical protein